MSLYRLFKRFRLTVDKPGCSRTSHVHHKNNYVSFFVPTASSSMVLDISPWFYTYTSKSHILSLLLELSFSLLTTSLQAFSSKFSLGPSIISPVPLRTTNICLELNLCYPTPIWSKLLLWELLAGRQESRWQPQQRGAMEVGKVPLPVPGCSTESEFPGVEVLW